MSTYTVGSGKDYSTIAAAVSAARANDTIIIDGGTYEEDDVEIYYTNITIKAATATVGSPNENNVIMDGLGSTSNDYAFDLYASGTVFQHITFKNFEEGAISMGGLGGRSLTVSGCLAYGCDGPVLGTIGFNASTPVEIKDCIFIVDEGRAVNIVGNSTIIMKNSVFVVNAIDEAVLMSSITYPNVTASHCTFVGRGYNGSDGRNYHLVAGLAQVDNCILYSTEGGSGIQATTHHHNLSYVNTALGGVAYPEPNFDGYDADADDLGAGDLTGDPKFVTNPSLGSSNPFNMDLNLQASSPAVDAGSSTFTFDISGSARDSSPDMGAYERVSVATGYGNTIMTVAAGSLGKVLGVTKANTSKVVGT
jgi:hypothetical protein